MSNPSYNAPAKNVNANLPPESKDAEMMVLGCMLTSINAVNLACSILVEEDFFYSQHKLIFRAIYTCFKHDIPVDLFIAFEELKNQKTDQVAGGVSYLTQCCQFAGTSANVAEYCQVIIDKATYRKVMNLSTEIHSQAKKEEGTAQEVLESAQKGFFDIGKRSGMKYGLSITDIFEEKRREGRNLIEDIQYRQEYYKLHGSALKIPGVESGFVDLDKMIENFGNSNLIIVAGRPGMGKTSFALNVLENVAIKQDKPIGMFSLEMSAEQLIMRVMSSMTGINSRSIQKGTLTESQMVQVLQAKDDLKSKTIVIDDQPDIGIAQLSVRARRWKEVYDIQILVIDYLHLIAGSGTKLSNDNQVQKIAEISRGLKILAKDLDIPILCVAQLNRKSEDRVTTGHRPIMSDIRDSGAIEQDADVILLLHRPEYYDANNKPGQAECIVAKNRHGEVGSVSLKFTLELAQFGNLATIAQIRSYHGFKDEE